MACGMWTSICALILQMLQAGPGGNNTIII